MKKFLTLVAVVAVAGAVGTASAMDRTGKIGLGYQESFAGGNASSAVSGSWSLKYGFTNAVTGQFILGFDFGNKGYDKSVNFGARILYNLVTNENSAFYTGLGVGWNQNKQPVDARALRIQVPLGWEFSFAGLPEIGFSAEVGILYDYVKATKQNQIGSVGGNVGGALGLGVHYYF